MNIELLLYIITCILSLIIIRFDYNNYCIKNSAIPLENRDYRKKINIFAIVAVSLTWVMFNGIITYLHPNMGDDWTNYEYNFNGIRETPSIGLAMMIKLVRLFDGDLYTLSRLSTFICVLITLIAYKHSRYASPQTVFFLFLTQYSYLSISLLKQTFANALASLFMVLAIENNSKKSNVICILLIVLACLFHPAGYVLIPLLIVLRMPLNKNILIIYSIIIVTIALFFNQFMVLIGSGASLILPSLGAKIIQYFNDDTIATQTVSLTFIKSLGEVLIVLMGVYKRNALSKIIKDYDKYLIVAITGVFFYLMSIYSVWLYRMIYLFYFSLFIFFDLVLRNCNNASNRRIVTVTTTLIFGVIMYRFFLISF